jgi:hypothetical protein
MRAYSLDERCELLGVEFCAQSPATPWLDRAWHRAMLVWLWWRIRRACRRRS